MSAKLNSKGEELWQDIRQHLDWNDGFALIFYFSSNVALTDIFKQRLQQFFIGHTTKLQEIHYQPDDPDWLHNTMLKLLNRDDNWRVLNAPVWVALHHTQDEFALEQYGQLLMRLNERRDVWRKAYPAPMMFILPESFKASVAGLAPDLWSIRVMAEELSEELVLFSDDISSSKNTYTQKDEDIWGRKIPESQQIILDEWDRLDSKGAKVSTERVTLGRRALSVLLNSGRLEEAALLGGRLLRWSKELSLGGTLKSLNDLLLVVKLVGEVAKQQGRLGDARVIYEEALGIARQLCHKLGNTPESLRDLSLLIDDTGMIAWQQGRLFDAQVAYDESLALSRFLVNTPESQRDLSVSLDNIGRIALIQGRWSDARSCYEESLDIRRRLYELLKTPRSVRDLSVSLDNVGDIAQQQGRWSDAQIVYEESLAIRRRLYELLGDLPEPLRDLSVSLVNVGKVAQKQGRWGDAQLVYEESLDISRCLKELLGDTPESLRDLSVSLDNVGKVAQQQGRWGDAQSAYEESLEIRRRLKELLGDTPESLRDLAVSLSKLGGLFEAQNDLTQAESCYEEGLALGVRLTKMLPDLPAYTEVEAFFHKCLERLVKQQ